MIGSASLLAAQGAEETTASTNQKVSFILSDGKRSIGPILGHSELQLRVAGESVGRSMSSGKGGNMKSATIYVRPGPSSSYLWRWYSAARRAGSTEGLARSLQITVVDGSGAPLTSYRLDGCIPDCWTIGGGLSASENRVGKWSAGDFVESLHVDYMDIQRGDVEPQQSAPAETGGTKRKSR